jgi:chromatin modification-related protein YNG2
MYQELLQDIARDQSRYIKSALKQGSTPSTPSSAGDNGNASPPSNSKAHLPARIATAYAEIDSLASEKMVLAQRIIDLLSRTRARLDSDLTKVRILQGEPPEEVRASTASYLTAQAHLRSSSPYMKREGSVMGLSPVIQIGESLRNVTGAQGEALPSITLSSGPSYNKSTFSPLSSALSFLITRCRMYYLTIHLLERRLTTTTSIKLPSPAPISISHQSASHSRSRLSRQSHTTRAQIQEEEDLDADAEGEDDIAEEDGEEDLTLYCFCHKQSYGDVSAFLPHLA